MSVGVIMVATAAATAAEAAAADAFSQLDHYKSSQGIQRVTSGGASTFIHSFIQVTIINFCTI